MANGYRDAGVVAPIESQSATAIYHVVYRAWWELAAAFVMFAGAMAFVISAAMAHDPIGAVLATMVAMVLLGGAGSWMLGGASEVELLVQAREDARTFHVILRRRYGFLPWGRDLVFSSTEAPSFEKTWDEGRSSGRYGPSTEYKRAILSLRVGTATLLLPHMPGPASKKRGVYVRSLAPEVQEAMARFSVDLAPLHKIKAKKDSASHGKEFPPLLVGSSEYATGWRPYAFLGVCLALATLLGRLAYVFSPSLLTQICAPLVLPLAGGSIALVSAVVAYGQTLYFKSEDGNSPCLLTHSDLMLFGTIGPPKITPLGERFPFVVEKRVGGEEEREAFALVHAESKQDLRVEDDEGKMFRFGELLGGHNVGPKEW